MYDTKVTNIKVSIKCLKISLDTVKEICDKNKFKTKIYNNFIIFTSEYIYTIFRSKEKNNYNHINITKIKQKIDIEKAIEKLQLIGIKTIQDSLIIDNITGSFDLKKELILKDLIEITQNYQFKGNIYISYNNEKFPGMFLKVKIDNKRIGTIIIFHSGKVVFVGCKRLRNLRCLESLTLALTSTK
jgi:TATA-box binding protein (TBP) (component of TFIID and TFIIIB)